MVQPVQHVVYAIHDYEIPGKGFLPLKAGDVLYVVDADASGWWLGVNLRRQKGVFPSTYTLPYVFPQPPADLQRDTQLLLLARDFAVDVTSGAPRPLHPLPIEPPPETPKPATADALRAELQGLLLTRETARKTVMTELTRLLDTRTQAQAVQQQAMDAQQAQQDQREVKRQHLHRTKEELRRVVSALEEQKKELVAHGGAPSVAWYASFADLVAAAAAADSDVDTTSVAGDATATHESVTAAACREDVWCSALKDVKSVVQQQESQLAALSSSCAAQEATFTDAAAALQSRIEWRDGKVAAMLVYWAEAAARTKSAYISSKAEREAVAVAHQQEAAQLRRRLEEGRDRFAEMKEAYRRLKKEAQAVSDSLKQQSALDALAREIAQVDHDIAMRQAAAQHCP